MVATKLHELPRVPLAALQPAGPAVGGADGLAGLPGPRLAAEGELKVESQSPPSGSCARVLFLHPSRRRGGGGFEFERVLDVGERVELEAETVEPPFLVHLLKHRHRLNLFGLAKRECS